LAELSLLPAMRQEDDATLMALRAAINQELQDHAVMHVVCVQAMSLDNARSKSYPSQQYYRLKRKFTSARHYAKSVAVMQKQRRKLTEVKWTMDSSTSFWKD
jgi:hypothetical protein